MRQSRRQNRGRDLRPRSAPLSPIRRMTVPPYGERRRNRVYYAPRLLRMLEEAAEPPDRVDARYA